LPANTTKTFGGKNERESRGTVSREGLDLFRFVTESTPASVRIYYNATADRPHRRGKSEHEAVAAAECHGRIGDDASEHGFARTHVATDRSEARTNLGGARVQTELRSRGQLDRDFRFEAKNSLEL
jgi:hypothetical protein